MLVSTGSSLGRDELVKGLELGLGPDNILSVRYSDRRKNLGQDGSWSAFFYRVKSVRIVDATR